MIEDLLHHLDRKLDPLRELRTQVASRVIPPRVVYWKAPRFGHSRVALTFDDGPDAEGTPRLLDALAEVGARGTFFLVGERAEALPDLVRRIHDEGHEIGNHSYSHNGYVYGRLRDPVTEIKRTNRVLASITGRQPSLFRPPFGLWNTRLLGHCLAVHMTIALWSVDPKDFEVEGGSRSAADLSAVEDGDIALMHDYTKTSAQLVRQWGPRLRERGLDLVTFSEMPGLV